MARSPYSEICRAWRVLDVPSDSVALEQALHQLNGERYVVHSVLTKPDGSGYAIVSYMLDDYD